MGNTLKASENVDSYECNKSAPALIRWSVSGAASVELGAITKTKTLLTCSRMIPLDDTHNGSSLCMWIT